MGGVVFPIESNQCRDGHIDCVYLAILWIEEAPQAKNVGQMVFGIQISQINTS
jgi:hypothetical protein